MNAIRTNFVRFHIIGSFLHPRNFHGFHIKVNENRYVLFVLTELNWEYKRNTNISANNLVVFSTKSTLKISFGGQVDVSVLLFDFRQFPVVLLKLYLECLISANKSKLPI